MENLDCFIILLGLNIALNIFLLVVEKRENLKIIEACNLVVCLGLAFMTILRM